MKNLFIVLGLLVASTSAHAAKYKCYPSKFQTDLTHFFADGFMILNFTSKAVNLKYYYVNTVARETTLEIDVNYKLGGVKGGTSAVKDMIVGSHAGGVKDYPGDIIHTMYFDQSLLKGMPEAPGVVGKFTFTGHGYSYDWNICYNAK